jgi:uncharacterized membrane protein YuzA (DUF378 family)
MQKDLYSRIISFLLGVSWGIILFGAFFIFQFSILFGLPLAIFTTIMYLIISLFLLLLLDAFSVNKQRLEEAKKQTQLLEKIYSKHTKA